MIPPALKPDDSIAALTLAELESLINHIIQQRQIEPTPWSAQMQAIKQTLAQPRPTAARSLADIALDLAAQVPPAEWAQIPTDASICYKDYLYGTPQPRQ